jgi:hypothetical protein
MTLSGDDGVSFYTLPIPLCPSVVSLGMGPLCHGFPARRLPPQRPPGLDMLGRFVVPPLPPWPESAARGEGPAPGTPRGGVAPGGLQVRRLNEAAGTIVPPWLETDPGPTKVVRDDLKNEAILPNEA